MKDYFAEYKRKLTDPTGAAEKIKPCGFTVYPNGSDKLIYYNPEAY